MALLWLVTDIVRTGFGTTEETNEIRNRRLLQ